MKKSWRYLWKRRPAAPHYSPEHRPNVRLHFHIPHIRPTKLIRQIARRQQKLRWTEQSIVRLELLNLTLEKPPQDQFRNRYKFNYFYLQLTPKKKMWEYPLRHRMRLQNWTLLHIHKTIADSGWPSKRNHFWDSMTVVLRHHSSMIQRFYL